jgi:hypothetical protein
MREDSNSIPASEMNLFPLCKANLLSLSLFYAAVNIAILSNGYRR